MEMKMILAVSRNGIIGTHNRGSNNFFIPWNLRRDLARFSKLTKAKNGVVVMGRETAETLDKELPDRTMVILTRNKDYISKFQNAIIVYSVPELLSVLENLNLEVWVMGGTQIYDLLIQYVTEIYLTVVHADIQVDDPVYAPSSIQLGKDGLLAEPKLFLASREYFPADEKNEYPATYYVFKKQLCEADLHLLQTQAIKALGDNSKLVPLQGEYEHFLEFIFRNGTPKLDRTNTGTISVFGYQMRFDLAKNFPLITTKKIHLKSIIYELLWFIAGDTNIQYLCKNGCNIWNDWPYARYQKSDEFKGETMKKFAAKIAEDDEFAKKWGDLGPVYGYQWRHWPDGHGGEIDQLKNLIHNLINNPDSRRHIISAWNVADIEDMTLPPCHSLFQFYVIDGKLSCQLYQRSADAFLGVPFNIASYALFTMMIAQVCGLELGDFVHTFGDAHIYANHMDQIVTQLKRESFEYPQVKVNPNVKSIFDFKYEDIELVNYVAHEAITGNVAV